MQILASSGLYEQLCSVDDLEVGYTIYKPQGNYVIPELTGLRSNIVMYSHAVILLIQPSLYSLILSDITYITLLH